MIVVLNPGHAHNTPGKCSPDKSLREYEWNVEVAERAKALLLKNKIDARIALAADNSVSLTYPVSVCNTLCNLHGKDNVLFISIHVNASGIGREWMRAKGWSVWTSLGQTKSDILADYLWDAADELYAPEHVVRRDIADGDFDYESSFYVLRRTKCPAVLIEHFFMDNKEDCEYLKTDECKQKAVEVILRGVQAYIDNLNNKSNENKTN